MGTRRNSRLHCVVCSSLMLVLLAVGYIPAEEKSPTPTPRPVGRSLADLAKNKKLNRDAKTSSSGSIVISNDNLDEYAEKGGLTEAGLGTQRRLVRDVHSGLDVRVVDRNAQQVNERKVYWQTRYLRQLALVENLRQQIENLDSEIPGLWRDFYAWDDPAYRDGVIKPKLDRSLERREELAEQLRVEEPMIEQIKIEARKDGAEPGWFREIKQPTPRSAQ
jgi:hypothetical protein